MLPKSNSFAIFVSVISSILLSSLILFFIASCGNNAPLTNSISTTPASKLSNAFVVETNMKATPLPPPASATGLNAALNYMGYLYRYPAEEKRMIFMTNSTAYFRDVMAAATTYVYNATDGETWTATATLPDGNIVQWPTVTFYNTYQGNSSCFVAPTWFQCGSNNIQIQWGINVQCKPPGLWKLNFLNNNKQIASTQFTLLPQIAPEKIFPHNQNNYSNPSLYAYDSICVGPYDPIANKYESVPCDATYTTKYTIAQKGCALTDAAIILSYHGVNTDPALLNTWLTNNGGYDPGGFVNRDSVMDYASLQGISISTPAAKPNPQNIWPKLSLAEQYICSGGPQEMGVKYDPADKRYHHWIIATGMDVNRANYTTVDPLGGVVGTTAQAGSLVTFSGPEYTYTDRSSIKISFHSPGDLIITDPQGRKLGYDPLTNITYKEIPDATYEYLAIDDDVTGAVDKGEKVIEIPQPVAGNYQLQVIGTGIGTYTLYIRARDPALNPAFVKTLWHIPIEPNVIHSYNFFFPKTTATLQFTAASTSFDGGGQRPVDVNKFLSYVYPTQTTTTLPVGTTKTSVVVLYDKSIIPATFTATLNGVNVTNLFKPTAGGIESVSLNLTPASRNILVLSVDGNLPGRVATDTDRLVFIVP